MGLSGRQAIRKYFFKILKENQIDFSILNGENAAEDGKGITKEIAEEFFNLGIDVITSGNHIWDKEETIRYIENEDRLLRPANLADGTPGKGYGIYFTKVGHFLDGRSTCVVGTHTHIPTADTRILENGTAYQTDLGMCGDYNSVIGMDKKNSIKRFFKEKDAVKHFPSKGDGTLSGIIVDADIKTGLAKKVSRLIIGGILDN